MKVYYPAMLDIKDKPCVVIGGGKVAERKITSLVKAGANITVISPDVTEDIANLVKINRIEWKQKTYEQGDLAGFFIVIIATNNKGLNEAIYRDTEHPYQLVNTIDDNRLCSFIVPSSFRRGHLQIAISTHGSSPSLAKKIREQLEEDFGPEYEEYTEFLANMRKFIIQQNFTEQQKRFYLKDLLEPNWLEAIKQKGLKEVETLCKAKLMKGE